MIQLVLDLATHITTRTSSVHHITLVLQQLYWPPIKFCINFKILLLTLKAIFSLTSPNLSELLHFLLLPASFCINHMCHWSDTCPKNLSLSRRRREALFWDLLTPSLGGESSQPSEEAHFSFFQSLLNPPYPSGLVQHCMTAEAAPNCLSLPPSPRSTFLNLAMPRNSFQKNYELNQWQSISAESNTHRKWLQRIASNREQALTAVVQRLKARCTGPSTLYCSSSSVYHLAPTALWP